MPDMNRNYWPIVGAGVSAGILALILGSVIGIALGMLAVYASGAYFDHLYPHDGQNALGAFLVGLLLAPLAALTAAILLYFPLFRRIRTRFTKPKEMGA